MDCPSDCPEQGYPENRFAVAVEDDLKCAICLSVLREPLQCEMNEHYFCAPCIKRHLRNNLKCPCCLDDLSLETLKKPSRYFTKHLGSLMVQCDHESRGCQEFVKLEDLARHLRECGYAPVSCQNDGCCEVVNKQDIFRHENELCERRRTDCHSCAETKKEITELKVAFEEFKAKKEIDQEASRKEIGELKVAFEELKKQVCQIADLKIKEAKISENYLYRPPSSGDGIVVSGCDVGPRFQAQPVQDQPSYLEVLPGNPQINCPTTHPISHNQQKFIKGISLKHARARPGKPNAQPVNQASAGGHFARNANVRWIMTKPLTPSILAKHSATDQKQILGEHLFPFIQQIQPNLAGKITGMLLEIDNSELLHMLQYRDALAAKVEEAVSILLAHQVPKGRHTSHP